LGWTDKKHLQKLVETLKKKVHLEELVVKEIIILKCILKKDM
jgi:hypothetical protein